MTTLDLQRAQNALGRLTALGLVSSPSQRNPTLPRPRRGAGRATRYNTPEDAKRARRAYLKKYQREWRQKQRGETA
jgi:hypothetical protein